MKPLLKPASVSAPGLPALLSQATHRRKADAGKLPEVYLSQRYDILDERPRVWRLLAEFERSVSDTTKREEQPTPAGLKKIHLSPDDKRRPEQGKSRRTT